MTFINWVPIDDTVRIDQFALRRAKFCNLIYKPKSTSLSLQSLCISLLVLGQKFKLRILFSRTLEVGDPLSPV